jgi:hypothetical protein
MKNIKEVTTERNGNPKVLQIKNVNKPTNKSKNMVFEKFNLMKMKTMILIPILVLCLNTNVQAEDQTEFSIKVANNNTFELQIYNVKKAHIEITLRDANGLLIQNEILMYNGIQKRKYKLRHLPDGHYTVVISYDETTKIQRIIKKTNWLVILPEDLQTISRTVFRQPDGSLDLGMTGICDTDMLVEILDTQGRVLYTELIEPDGYFERRFNLSLLEEDLYTFRVSTVGFSIDKKFQEIVYWSQDIEASE